METNECLKNNGDSGQDKKENITDYKDTFRGRVCECSQPPMQLQIDRTLRKLKLLGKGKLASLNLEEFRAFILALFRDMALSSAFKSMAFYIPVEIVAILSSHLIAQRLPIIDPTYRTRWPSFPESWRVTLPELQLLSI